MKYRTALAAALLLLLLGCGKLTLENYRQITVGMHYDEVVRLIGAPDNCDDVMGIRSCTWSEGQRSVKVSFASDQVLLYSSSNLK